MTDNQSKDTGFLDHLKGGLLMAFSLTPLGTALGLNPITRSPLVRTGVNETAKDTVRDIGLAVKYLATLGDKQAANKTADEIEQGWRKHVTQNLGMGQLEFRLGSGWKLPPSTLYNGKIDKEKEGQPLPMDAVFLRNKNGSIEVLDHNDPRYLELAMPYVVGQVAIPIGAGKAMGAIKLIANGGKIVDGLVKGADIAGKSMSAVNTIGGIGYAGAIASNMLILKPESIAKISHLLDDPNKMQPAVLREELNTIFEQYSYLNGPMAEQYFISPIKPNENPLKRLEELSNGILRGVNQSANPFDRITSTSKASDVQLTEVRNKVRDDPHFMKGFYKSAIKALSNSEMSANEMLAFKFGMNVYFGGVADITNQGSNPAETKAERGKMVEKFKFLYIANDYEALQDDASKGKRPTSADLSDLLKSQLKQAEAKAAEMDRPKHPIIQNRKDSPFVLG